MADSDEGEGSVASSAHSSSGASGNPVESGTSSTCPSESEGTESSVLSLLQRLRAPRPSEKASLKDESTGRHEAREGSLLRYAEERYCRGSCEGVF